VFQVQAQAGVNELCSQGRRFTLKVLPPNQVYLWVPRNLILEVMLRGKTLPSTGEEEYKFFQSLSATETGICFSCKYELFGLMQNILTTWLQAKSRIKCAEQVMAGLIP